MSDPHVHELPFGGTEPGGENYLSRTEIREGASLAVMRSISVDARPSEEDLVWCDEDAMHAYRHWTLPRGYRLPPESDLTSRLRDKYPEELARLVELTARDERPLRDRVQAAASSTP